MHVQTIVVCIKIKDIWQTLIDALNVTFRGGKQLRTQMNTFILHL